MFHESIEQPMFELFISSGVTFMTLITIPALLMLFFAGQGAVAVFGTPAVYQPGKLYYIRFFGMLALVFGVFGQIIGLYQAMSYISQMEGVSQQMLAGGIRVSSITTMYGFIIFLIAHILWFVLDLKGKSIPTGA
jgi:hypothetical protein